MEKFTAEITFHFFSNALRDTAWPLHFKFASYAYELHKCHFGGSSSTGYHMWQAGLKLQDSEYITYQEGDVALYLNCMESWPNYQQLV